MGEAQRIQAERDAADLANHRERLAWLSAPNPCWSCGSPVDAHTRHALLIQSQNAIKALGGAA